MAKVGFFSNNRGYLFTVLSYLIVVSIFSLAVFFSNMGFDYEKRSSVLSGFYKTTMFADNIASSIKTVYDISPVSSNSTLTIGDHMTADYDISSLLSSYLSYLDSFANETGVSLSFPAGGVVFSIGPGNFTYEYDSFMKNAIYLHSPSSLPSKYSVILTVPDYYSIGTTDSYTVPGSFPLYVEFEKESGHAWTAVDGLVDMGSCSWYYMDFDSGASSLNVSAGACLGYSNALIIRNTGGQKVDTLIVMNLSSPSMFFSSNLTLSDAVSGFSVSGYPALSRP